MGQIKENFDLQAYVTSGVENVVRDALKATLKDPRESAFMLRFAAASKAASKKRRAAEDAGAAGTPGAVPPDIRRQRAAEKQEDRSQVVVENVSEMDFAHLEGCRRHGKEKRRGEQAFRAFPGERPEQTVACEGEERDEQGGGSAGDWYGTPRRAHCCRPAGQTPGGSSSPDLFLS